MANSYADNVIFVDTTNADYDMQAKICGIKYIGASSGTAEILSGTGAGGASLWEQDGNSNIFEEVDIRADNGFRVNVTNSATVYIYLK
jgi:hypothetical protein